MPFDRATLSHLETYENKKNGGGVLHGTVIAWPAFIAACEAVSEDLST